MLRLRKSWSSARVPSLRTCGPDIITWASLRAMLRPSLPSNSISSSFSMFHALHLNSGDANTLAEVNLPCETLTRHPHHSETRQHEYVALPMCSHVPCTRLSRSRSHCSLVQSNPSQVRRGRRCARLQVLRPPGSLGELEW